MPEEVSVKTESGLSAAAPSEPRIRPGADSGCAHLRVTQGGRRWAQDPDKDKDILYTKKMRTRRHHEDV